MKFGRFVAETRRGHHRGGEEAIDDIRRSHDVPAEPGVRGDLVRVAVVVAVQLVQRLCDCRMKSAPPSRRELAVEASRG